MRLLWLLSVLMAIHVGQSYLWAAESEIEKNPILLMEQDVGLRPEHVALVINQSDPTSRQVGEYYRQKRNIPRKNVVYVDLKTDLNTIITPKQFVAIKKKIDQQLPQTIQIYVLAWTTPYRVGCMSITSAFALGYDENYCANGCKPTKRSPYYESESRQPWEDLQIRPAMLLAGKSIDEVKQLIDRGVLSDSLFPTGKAYLLDTHDQVRSVRRIYHARIKNQLEWQLPIVTQQANSVKNKADILFYFTGLAKVDGLATNHYAPGAIADHLTSYGGQLVDSPQMSVLEWLSAGVTGSYGTVVEPCAFLEKFPNPLVLMEKYLAGEHLIEAYWKSVAMPGQGVFVGEPLARPWYGYHIDKDADGRWVINAPMLKSGYYRIEGAKKRNGPFYRIADGVVITRTHKHMIIAPNDYSFWRIVPEKSIDTEK